MDIKRLKTIQSNFLKEIQDTYNGKKTSLPFIINQIPPTSLVKDGEIFQALVIGGSVYKKAILKKGKEKITIVKIEEGDQPLFKTAKDFFLFVEKLVDPNINMISINFAYRIKPPVRELLSISKRSRLDGVLIGGSKENTFDGLIGEMVGERIELYFKKKNKEIMVVVANDTICLLFAALTKYEPMMLAGGADGTGVNFAFFLDKEKAVNLESASFDKFPQSKEGKIIASTSSNRGGWLFEKETAGAYLYKHFNLMVKERGIDYPQISSTEELNALGASPQPNPLPQGERERERVKQVQHDMIRVSEIARNLLTRSAQLVACQIAGITEFKQGQNIISRHSGKHQRIQNLYSSERFWTRRVPDGNPSSQNDKMNEGMVFNMEGSLFWKANNYKQTVEQTVKRLLPKYNVKFVQIKESGILGAAKLVS